MVDASGAAPAVGRIQVERLSAPMGAALGDVARGATLRKTTDEGTKRGCARPTRWPNRRGERWVGGRGALVRRMRRLTSAPKIAARVLA
jgi:hypothetical protein